MAKLLLVEDDQTLCATIKEMLDFEHYVVDIAITGEQAKDCLAAFDYDLIILDWELPEASGIEVCQQFRAKGGLTPVLMLTGKQAIDEKETGFEAGADDYLTKPFHMKELAARVRALLKRPRMLTGNTLTWGDIALDSKSHRVTRNGADVPMQPLEFTLLEFFMKHPGQIFGTDTLLRRCWDADSEASLDAIYTCIRRIRRKLDTDGKPSILKTVHGVGYRFDLL